MKKIDLTGYRFGKLLVLKESSFKDGFIAYECVCDCGKSKIISGKELRGGNHKSCGCMQRAKRTSASYRRLRSIWKAMIRRCYNEKHPSYHRYGGRGILVCEKWHTFEGFYKDMESVHQFDFQLDRIDNNKGYEKENCRFISKIENMRNSSIVKMSKEKADQVRASSLNQTQLAKIYGVTSGTISRIKSNKAWV